MSTLVCVQRVLCEENQDYDDTFGGVTWHFVLVRDGDSALQRAVSTLRVAGVPLVPVGFPHHGDDEVRDAVRVLDDQLVAALSKRDSCPAEERELALAHTRGRAPVRPMVELDYRVWHPLLAAKNAPDVPRGAGTLLVHFRDDKSFQHKINAYIDSQGIDIEDAEDEDEDDDDEDEDDDDDDIEETEDEEDDPAPKRRRGDESD